LDDNVKDFIIMLNMVLMPYVVWLTRSVYALRKDIEMLAKDTDNDRSRMHSRIDRRPNQQDFQELKTAVQELKHNQEMVDVAMMNKIVKIDENIQLMVRRATLDGEPI